MEAFGKTSVLSSTGAEDCGGWGAYENDLEKHLLVHLHELLIPLLDFGGLFPRVRLIVVSGGRVVAVVLAPLDDLAEDRFRDVRLEGP